MATVLSDALPWELRARTPAPALMQIESNGRELVMCDKVVERVIDAHHTHVLGHAQAAIAQRGDGAVAIWSFAA